MTADTTQDGRRARLRHRANLAEARRMPKMTPDEIEQERADRAEPWTPFEQALAEVLQETVALSDRTLPPGLDMRLAGETVEILSRGAVVGTVNRRALADREAQIVAERARQAGAGPN